MTTGFAESSDWSSRLLAHLRGLIMTTEPEITEEIKWRKPSNPLGVVAWSLNGLICTGETYEDKVKQTFAKGAALDDPEALFNGSLEAALRQRTTCRPRVRRSATATAPPALASEARGVSLDPTNNPILEAYGDNALRYRMRAHPNVAQIHHDDLIQAPRGAI